MANFSPVLLLFSEKKKNHCPPGIAEKDNPSLPSLTYMDISKNEIFNSFISESTIFLFFIHIQALMLYKLYHEKKVKTLDDPFKKYLPSFSIKDPFKSHDITLR